MFLFLFILLVHSDKLLICFGLFLKTFRVVLHLIRSRNNYFTSHFSFIQKCNNLFMKTRVKKRKNNFYQIHKKRSFSLRYQVSSWTFRILELLWSEIQIIHYTLFIQSESVDLKLTLFICILKSNFIIYDWWNLVGLLLQFIFESQF